jgi:hypothetical protein
MPRGAAVAGERRGLISVTAATQTPVGPLDGWHGKRPLSCRVNRGNGDCGNVPDKGMVKGGDAVYLDMVTADVVGTITWRCRQQGRRP